MIVLIVLVARTEVAVLIVFGIPKDVSSQCDAAVVVLETMDVLVCNEPTTQVDEVVAALLELLDVLAGRDDVRDSAFYFRVR